MKRRTFKRSGFTLVELLVVVAISALISSMAIVYSRVGQNQVTLSVEASKISQFMLQAKQLSIATYGKAGISCAFGVFLDPATQTYSLFVYTPIVTPPCPSITTVTSISTADMKPYSESTWQVPVAPGVKILPTSPLGDVLSVVLFYPPSPTTFMSRDIGDPMNFLVPAQTSHVYLATSDGSATAQISVNPAGQISF